MTPEKRKLCQDLIIFPDGTSRISEEEFLRKFPSAVKNGRLNLDLLEDALRTQNAEDVQCTLIIGNVFGFSPEDRNILCQLLNAKWHFMHEDIVSALGELKSPQTLDALYQITQWIPEYLEYDDSRALAVKAIWAIGGINAAEAEQKLTKFLSSTDPILKAEAEKQLQYRKESSKG